MLAISSEISLVDCSRLLRQLADFVGHHGETQAVLTGTGRFDRGVQRQQVGLLGQIVDDLDDLADVVGARAQARR